jgi:hypothetical protein
MSTRENPAKIIERTLTAHFFGTIDAYKTARPGMLINPTNVAAVICHVLSAGLSQLGYGTYEVAPIRWITKFSSLSCVPARLASDGALDCAGTTSHFRRSVLRR